MRPHNLHQPQLEHLHSLPSCPGTSGMLLCCVVSPRVPSPAPQGPPAAIPPPMTRWRPVGLRQVLAPPRAHARSRPAAATAPCAISEYAASRTYKGSYHALWPRFGSLRRLQRRSLSLGARRSRGGNAALERLRGPERVRASLGARLRPLRGLAPRDSFSPSSSGRIHSFYFFYPPSAEQRFRGRGRPCGPRPTGPIAAGDSLLAPPRWRGAANRSAGRGRAHG